MVCRKVDDKNCLSQAQADAMKRYFGAITDADGKPLYPGPGIGDFSTTASLWSLTRPPDKPDGPVPWNSQPPICWSAADGTIRDFVELDPKFDSNRDWPERDGKVSLAAQKLIADRMHPGHADRPEQLQKFFADGRKLLLYHGFADSAISPYRTMMFYEEMAKRSGGYGKLQSKALLYMVPGMGHCGGGPGPNNFDTLTALEEWVEQGKAPDELLARHYRGNDRGKKIDRTMPLCRFPAQAQYDGKGDLKEAANWSCPQNEKLLETGPNGLQAGLSDPGGRHP
jgi:feruloyl esterase